MKDNVFLKVAMSVFYSLVLTLMLVELITKPIFEPLFDIAVHDTGIPANYLLDCNIFVWIYFTFFSNRNLSYGT